tara:strand:- start:143 stop:736 length:594 start_codon:yes stop_codon:yes gene_type:complete
MADDFEDDSGGFMDRIKESPRTVSALIIILIVAAAIYAFSGEEPDEAELAQDSATEVTTEVDDDATIDEAGAVAGDTAVEPTAVSAADLMEETKTLPEPTRTAEGFQEVAQPGDGITHLARRSATRWLSENQAGYAVTNEHRIYIEDYIQNQMGSEGLAVGETRMVSLDLIAEAVAAAGQLNDQQLRNLTQYTSALN